MPAASTLIATSRSPGGDARTSATRRLVTGPNSLQTRARTQDLRRSGLRRVGARVQDVAEALLEREPDLLVREDVEVARQDPFHRLGRDVVGGEPPLLDGAVEPLLDLATRLRGRRAGQLRRPHA